MSRRHALILLAILTLSIGCDQATKQLAVSALGDSPISMAGDAVRLQLAYNEGAFLSMGASLPPAVRGFAFQFLAPLLMLIVCGLAIAAGIDSFPALLGVALIAGGGIGNWIDRLLHDGFVTDFVSVGFGPLRTGIFNLADVCIVAGVLLLVLGSRSKSGNPEPEAAG